MTYKTLMVSLNLGESNERVLDVAASLAQRFDAHVIGIAGGHPMQIDYAEGYSTSDAHPTQGKAMSQQMADVQAEFRNALQARVDKLEWRETQKLESLGDFAARQARSTDLLITGVSDGECFGTPRAVRAVDLIMCLGRPVLVVPATADKPRLECVLVAWKDTRESRRAAADALPLLKRAAHVCVVEIADEADLREAQVRLDDVVAWLARHGVVAQALAASTNPADFDQLGAIASAQGADLIVAGGYGHSRLREWVMGGVTRRLLQGAQRCSLLSH
jgi:nucleotide-binding universal stress UspA family protein